jgi:hypothetical protein
MFLKRSKALRWPLGTHLTLKDRPTDWTQIKMLIVICYTSLNKRVIYFYEQDDIKNGSSDGRLLKK